MVDKLQLASKPLGATKMFTRILITAGAIVFFLQPGFSKNSEKVKAAIKQTLEQYDAHRYTVKEADEIHTTTYTDFSTFHQKNLDGGGDTGTNALDFAVKNVDLYYPGMHQHLDSLINHLRDQEQKDTVNFLFQEHIFKNISDPKKQVAAVIYAMENMVFKGIGITKKFNKEHGKEYDMMTIFADNRESSFLFNFNREYNHWFMRYSQRLNQVLDELNKELDMQKKDIKSLDEDINSLNQDIIGLNKKIEGIISTFTVDQVVHNPNIKALVLETEAMYTKHQQKIFPHLALLAAAAKQ